MGTLLAIGSVSLRFLLIESIAAHLYEALLARSFPQKLSIAAHSYTAFLITRLTPQNSSNWNPAHTTDTLQICSGDNS